jgi:serpin B
MKRITMDGRALLALTLAAAASQACGATNTGNPTDPGGPGGDAPAGVQLLRSALERETAPAIAQSELEQLALGSRDFALALYTQAASESAGTDDVFISPYSVSVALAMTYAGAASETKTEMASALHFDLPEPALHAAWNATGLDLAGRPRELAGGKREPGEPESSGDGLTLEVKNALFAQRGFTPNEPFLDTLAVHYDAGLYAADFARDPEAARVAINDWTASPPSDASPYRCAGRSWALSRRHNSRRNQTSCRRLRASSSRQNP